MFNENLNNKLEMFDLVHLLTIIFLSLIIILLFVFRNKISDKKFEKGFSIFLGTFLLIFETSFHIWIFSRGSYGLGMIPLFGFCALVNVLTIFALLFNKTTMFNYLIYYALTGTVFSLLFVDISWTIPHFRFFHYFFIHFGFLLASLYYYFTNKIQINLHNFKKSIIILSIYSVIILILDIVMQDNWFYLIENPIKEISDSLGMPFYTILWMFFISVLMCFWYLLLKGFKIRRAS